MRTVSVSTPLACSADAAFDAVGAIQTFVHVARGAIRFPAAERRLAPVEVGDSITGWVLLFGVVPFSRHTIEFVEVDREHRRLVSNERGGMVRQWNHTISVTPEGEHTCRYVDRIEIDAGPFTSVVVGYAAVFYRYRQWRWRRLAPVLDGAARVREARRSVAR